MSPDFSALPLATASGHAGDPAEAARVPWHLLISKQVCPGAPETQSSVLNNAVWKKAGMCADGTLKCNCCQTGLQWGGGQVELGEERPEGRLSLSQG